MAGLSDGECMASLAYDSFITAPESQACLAAANTSYCFPPNGTRICVPAEDIPFIWPPNFYHFDSKIAVEYDLTDNFVFLRNNTGIDSQDFTPYMYNSKATNIQGVEGEKNLKMYFAERRFNDEDDPFNLEIHEGPEIILVKTSEFPSTTSASTRPTSTFINSDNDDDDDDDGPKMPGKKIAGIVLGVIFGVFAIIMFCCCGCCKPRPLTGARDNQVEPDLSTAERADIANTVLHEPVRPEPRTEPSGSSTMHATPQIFANFASSEGVDSASVDSRNDEDRGTQREDGEDIPPPYSEPPPKYTP